MEDCENQAYNVPTSLSILKRFSYYYYKFKRTMFKTCWKAPGKILLAGGYSILFNNTKGLVLGV